MAAIYLVRHGQASFGLGDYDVLSARGKEQSAILGRALGPRIGALDAAACGSMRRQRDTAAICLAELGASASLVEDVGWNELDHDEIIVRAEPRYANKLVMKLHLARTLRPKQAFQRVFVAALERWVGGAHDADYAEPWPAFAARVEAALARLVERLASGGCAIAFTSGGPIMALCAARLGLRGADALRLNWPLVNAGVTKLVVGRRGATLASYNEHAHFENRSRRLITYR